MPEKHFLRQMQALPLRAKVLMSSQRIREWYDHFNGDVCVSFSGGKDSTVLAHLVHDWYPDVPLVFCNTGLEFPEIQSFARKMGAEFVYPKMNFSEVISTYGYPIISKENAEAIYYARRIRNAKGNDKTETSRNAVNSSVPGNVGGGYWETRYKRELVCGRAVSRSEWKRNLQAESGHLRGSTGMGSATGTREYTWGGYLTTARKRNEINGSRVYRGGTATEENRPDGRSALGERDRDGQTDDGSITDGRRKYGEWRDWRREAIAGVGAFEETSSIFNKKKWLPLCYETRFMISHMCCSVMKKGPMKAYQKKTHRYPYIGTLTEESKLREQAWIRHGCNAFDATNKTSQPMSFWTEQDVLHYLYEEGYEIATVYGDIVAVDENGFEYEPFFASGCKLKCTGCSRTGCIFCGFGLHLEKGETRFQRLARTHPKQYEYCLGGGQWVDNPKYDPTAPKMDGDWENWNPKKIWVPSKEGLGMKKVFDDCNAIYGKDFIRYE